MTAVIAALYVDPRGCYAGLPGVDIWDEKRDARLYGGPCPVVAHPPCQRWCRMDVMAWKRWGMPEHLRPGNDGGTFAAALASVRKWGGVLEHPAYSKAWSAHGIARPPSGEGWVSAGECGGWTCYVEQVHYGHVAKKATWLYVHGTRRDDLPELNWTVTPDRAAKALVSWCGNRISSGERRPRVGKKAAAATPQAFRDILIAIALRVAP